MKLLADTAGGTLPKREKITLETFVQMAYFDRILRRANSRLMKMTNGQYDLIRRKTADSLKSQSGLELDVIDHYNDTVRSVNTLSGGESFKASLALALGLSDEIQSSAGRHPAGCDVYRRRLRFAGRRIAASGASGFKQPVRRQPYRGNHFPCIPAESQRRPSDYRHKGEERRKFREASVVVPGDGGGI